MQKLKQLRRMYRRGYGDIMKYCEVSYERVYNLGNYESEKIGLKAQCDEGESVDTVLKALQDKINSVRSKK